MLPFPSDLAGVTWRDGGLEPGANDTALLRANDGALDPRLEPTNEGFNEGLRDPVPSIATPSPSRATSMRRDFPGREGDLGSNVGALIIGIGLGGSLFYNYNKEPPK